MSNVIPGLLGPNPTDPRDYHLSEIQKNKESLPNEYFIYRDKKYIENQNGKGVCYSYAVLAIQEFLNSQEYNKDLDFSERYLVHFTKKISGIWNSQGDFTRNAMKAITKYGCALEEDWETDLTMDWDKFAKTEPSQNVIEKAKKYKGKTYWKVGTSPVSIKIALVQQEVPVKIAMPWFNSYYSTPSTGKLPLPENKVGGHAVLIIGFENGKIWFANSFGSSFGNNGYFYIEEDEWNEYNIWSAYVLLDLEKQPDVGYVAGSYLKPIKLQKGDIMTPGYNLNFRKESWGDVIETLKPGDKLKVVGEPQKGSNYTWQKVKKL